MGRKESSQNAWITQIRFTGTAGFLELWRTYDRLKAQEELVFDRFDI